MPWDLRANMLIGCATSLVLLTVLLDLAQQTTAHGVVFSSRVVETPGGPEAAEKLASELGFRNRGQVR